MVRSPAGAILSSARQRQDNIGFMGARVGPFHPSRSTFLRVTSNTTTPSFTGYGGYGDYGTGSLATP